jgi:hypothetical protein
MQTPKIKFVWLLIFPQSLFLNDAFSTELVVKLQMEKWLRKKHLGMTWKKASVTYFQTLSQFLRVGTERNLEKLDLSAQNQTWKKAIKYIVF